MRVPKWWKYPAVFVFGVVYSLCMMWLGYSKHDCPETVVEVASDTIPPVTQGWVIVGDSLVMPIQFDSYENLYRFTETKGGDSAIYRIYSDWHLVEFGTNKRFRCADVFADRTLAEAELCRRTDAQIEELRKKREKVCED